MSEETTIQSNPSPALGLTLWRKIAAGLLVVAVLLPLAACKKEDPMTIASIGGYNHSTEEEGLYIRGFSVDGGSGANLGPESGESGSVCCVRVPKRWYPGMKVKVQWSYSRLSDDKRLIPPPQEATVDVPDYNIPGGNGGNVSANFYPDNRVIVVVTSYGIEHPDYPLSEADKLPFRTDPRIPSERSTGVKAK